MASDLVGHISFTEKSIAALFFNMADKNPEKTAIWCDGEELTYQELNSLVCRYANYLASRGVVYGDIIGIPMNNSVESVALLLAAAAIGAGLAPVNATLPMDAADKAFKTAGVKHLIARKSFFRAAGRLAFPYLSGCCLCLDGEVEGADPFASVLQASDKRPDVTGITGDETFILTMTSGSTGNSKTYRTDTEN